MSKIYIDGMALINGHFSGIGQYILGIMRGIDELLEDELLAGNSVPKVCIMIPKGTSARFKSFNFKHITSKAFPLSHRYMAALWHRGWLPPVDLLVGRGKYLFPCFVDMPLAFSKNSGVTIYDLSFELYKQYSEEKNAKFLSAKVKGSVTRATNIFTISQNAKKEIIKFYNIDPKNVIVATPAVDQTHLYHRSEKEISFVKTKYDIGSKNYILALSNLEPRKNLETLVDVYCNLPAKYQKDNALLLVGVNGWKADKLFSKIMNKIKQGHNIIRPNQYVSDEDKPAIISGASMLVYPSHYEGFGIPPLEALACGIPVITSDNSSLPEVVKGIGKMIPSNSPAKLQKTIEEYLDNIVAITDETKTLGPKRASEFSWKQSAKLYLNTIMENEG